MLRSNAVRLFGLLAALLFLLVMPCGATDATVVTNNTNYGKVYSTATSGYTIPAQSTFQTITHINISSTSGGKKNFHLYDGSNIVWSDYSTSGTIGTTATVQIPVSLPMPNNSALTWITDDTSATVWFTLRQK